MQLSFIRIVTIKVYNNLIIIQKKKLYSKNNLDIIFFLLNL